MVQSREVSNETVGIEPKSPQPITVVHIPLVAGFAIGGNSVLSSQEDLDPIDRDLAKFDQNGSGVSADESNLRIGLSQVLVGSTVAGSTQFLKNFFVASALTSLFTMGSKTEPSRTTVSKVSHWQKVPRKNKEEQGSLLVKRVTQESNKEMKEVEGNRKRRAIYEVDPSMEASD
nr:hypothetical protein CFP56_55812 [Quercus suber]